MEGAEARGWARVVRRLDPRVPFRLEGLRGGSAWWAVAVAAYAVAWQLLAAAAALAGCIWVVTPHELGWSTVRTLAMPAGAVALLGAVASWGDHLAEEPFRWYAPWTALRAAWPALAYAFGSARLSSWGPTEPR